MTFREEVFLAALGGWLSNRYASKATSKDVAAMAIAVARAAAESVDQDGYR